MLKVIAGRVSDELYESTIGEMNRNPEKYSNRFKSHMIHMVDSCSRGYIRPIEVDDAWRLGYVPDFFLVRPSMYVNIL